MQKLEKFSAVFLIAGVILFIIAVFTLAVIPVMMVEKTQPYELSFTKVPRNFQSHYSNPEDYEKALYRGRDLYIREACWHCHSQYVRPTANEVARYGMVSTPGEYQNKLHLPQLFGTRRVGPDLSREAGKKSNDWHFAHLYDPTSVVPESVMPKYPWYFKMAGGEPMVDEDGDPITDDDDNPVYSPIVPVPTEDGVALVAYLQWLGSNVAEDQEFEDFESTAYPPKE